MKISATQQFVIMPARGLRAAMSGLNSPDTVSFLTAHTSGTVSLSPFSTRGGTAPPIKILDSIHQDGAKLIETSTEGVMALRAAHPGVRVVPVVYFKSALAPRPAVRSAPKVAARRSKAAITLRVVSKPDGKPIAGAHVIAFTDFADRLGAEGRTNRKGEARLNLGGSRKKVDRLYVYPELGYWSFLKKAITLSDGIQIALEPLRRDFVDGASFFYGASVLENGQGVTVAVIDAGVDTAHPDLVVAGGMNTVHGEKPDDYGDNGGHHGTHVAGIIAARGSAPHGRLGIAPGVGLRSYRVFGKNSDRASNFAIAKAVDRAVADGCDLINMSLGGGEPDPLTQAAIADARSAGVLVIVAAGNDYRSAVSWPAADERATAVSAMGRKGTFPGNSAETGYVAPPYGKDRKNFMAAFSNVGIEIDLTAPGVGIVSTVPGGYAVMSGTSMACPAVTGFAARIIARQPNIFALPRNQVRSDAMAQALFSAAKSLGFGPEFEGHGLAS